MGIFNRSKTPPPAASEPSHTGTPIQSTQHQQQPAVSNQTGTTYTPTSEMPAPQYTQHDNINSVPPPGAHETHYTNSNEKSAALNAPHPQAQTYNNSDPSLLHNQQQQQQFYPDHNAQQQYSQSQIHVQPHPQQHQSNADFHAHDKNQHAQQQQQQFNGQQQQQGQGQGYQQQGQRNVYNVARPLHSLQGRAEVVDCPNCGVRELTRTEFASGGTTHFAAAVLCFCLCLGCIPYIGHWIKNCEHYCGNCNQLLAIWHRSGDTEVIQRRQGPAGPQGGQQQQQQKPGGPGAQYK